MDPLTRELIGLALWIAISSIAIAGVTRPKDRFFRHVTRAITILVAASGIGWLLTVAGEAITGIHLCNYFGFAGAALLAGFSATSVSERRPWNLPKALAISTAAVLVLPYALGVGG